MIGREIKQQYEEPLPSVWIEHRDERRCQSPARTRGIKTVRGRSGLVTSSLSCLYDSEIEKNA